MTANPCPRCINAHMLGAIRKEAIMPLPEGAAAPLDLDGNPYCYDCASADSLVKMGIIGGRDPFDHGHEDEFEDSCASAFMMARTAVGNDRQEQFRLPGVPMGLVLGGYVRASKKGDWEKHLEWQESQDLLQRMPT